MEETQDARVTFDWFDSGTAEVTCPVCADASEKPKVLRLSFPELKRGYCIVLYVSCPACGSVFQGEYALPAYEDEEIYFDGFVDFYLELGASIDSMLGNLYLLPPEGTRYLEVGTGFGYSLDFARTAFGYECLGLDPAPLAQAGARTLGVDIRPAYFTSPDDVPGKFDLIGCSEVIEHIPHPLPFTAALRETLQENGAVWITTPNAALITRQTDLARLKSIVQGWHPVLFTKSSLELILRKAGFSHVEVWEADASLYAVASMTPKKVDRGAQPDRDAYLRYLQDRWSSGDPSTPVGCGFGVRLYKELVNLGRYGEVAELDAALEQMMSSRFDVSLADPTSLPLGSSFKEFGENLPYNITVLLFHKGIWSLNHLRDVEGAEACFSGAFRAGSALLGFFEHVGCVDQQTHNLTGQSLVHALMCLDQMGPARTLSRCAQLRRIESPVQGAVRPLIAAKMLPIQAAEFVDLVMSGNYAAAGERLEAWGADFAGDIESVPLPAKPAADFWFSKGIWTMNHLGDYPQAAGLFDRALGIARGEVQNGDLELGAVAWQALFHKGLAHRMAGDRAAAEAVAQALYTPGRGAGAGLPPIDQALRRRIVELV